MCAPRGIKAMGVALHSLQGPGLDGALGLQGAKEESAENIWRGGEWWQGARPCSRQVGLRQDYFSLAQAGRARIQRTSGGMGVIKEAAFHTR